MPGKRFWPVRTGHFTSCECGPQAPSIPGSARNRTQTRTAVGPSSLFTA